MQDNAAIILAGGEGRRLLSLTRQLSGDDRPKQFCAVLGDETLLSRDPLPRDAAGRTDTDLHSCHAGPREVLPARTR